jgi:hypothetical protein
VVTDIFQSAQAVAEWLKVRWVLSRAAHCCPTPGQSRVPFGWRGAARFSG